ncbi:MAG: RNA polymerase sigma factor [Anaerolineae bacterium]
MSADASTTTASHEEQLLARARAGDRRAFDALQLSLQPQVRRFTVYLLGSSPDTGDLPAALDEVAQDVFLALFRSLHRVTSVAHLHPFLFRVCRNCCYDRMRRSRGRYQEPLDEESEDGDDALVQSPPDEATMWTLALFEVDRAIARLSEPQRLAIYLYAEEGMTYPEVAEAAGTDVGTVKSRIFNARKRLRALLSPGLLQALGFSKEA